MPAVQSEPCLSVRSVKDHPPPNNFGKPATPFTFFSINNLRTITEVSIISNNFKKYLDISAFMKQYNITNTVLTNTLNKLIEQINIDIDLQDLSIQWDLLDIKLTKLNKFNNFEIECIKLIVAIKYNEYLLNNVNNYMLAFLYKKQNCLQIYISVLTCI